MRPAAGEIAWVYSLFILGAALHGLLLCDVFALVLLLAASCTIARCHLPSL